ncbi:hypothetical protein HDV00_006153 [Rhizophlyctis rosea]|nr:hypothetical protein HDV00_006153 [Rhizophlyctis rosea]
MSRMQYAYGDDWTAQSSPVQSPASFPQRDHRGRYAHSPPRSPRALSPIATLSRQGSGLNLVDGHPASGPITSSGPPSLNRQQSTVHPALDDIDALNEYIESEPSNIIQILPDLSRTLERFCLDHPDSCKDLWTQLKPILEHVQKKMEVPPEEPIPARPPSPECTPKPHKWVNVHGEEWEDDYGWLRDAENPEVLDYIKAENDYTDTMLAHTKPLRRLLYKEFVARIDESEESAQVTLQDGWTYYSKRVAGEEYRLHCRIKDGEEDVYLDENQLVANEFADASYFKVGFLKHSPDCALLAYGIDSVGNERYTTYFMDMNTKRVLEDRIEGAYENLEFAADGRTVYYTILDEYERAYQLKRHQIGTDVATDPVLYHEEDEMYFLTLTKSCNGKYIILNSSAQVTSETRFISTERLEDPCLLFPRREGIRYTCENHGNHIYILTNEDSKNNWLFRIPTPTSPTQNWEDLLTLRETVIEHRDFVLIEDFVVRRNHLIVFERSNCLQNVRIVDLRDDGFSNYHYVSFSEMVYSLYPGSVNEEVADLTKSVQFDTTILRFTYTSFTQPKQVVDYDMDTREMTVVHEEKVKGMFDYDPSMYVSKRLFATGIDGTAVPVSIVYRRDLLGANMNPAQPNPCLLHAYGAYGAFVNPIFSSHRLSLLDRGFIYAAAHVRGGADMGNGWYEEGKLGKKPNTFYDFCSVAEYLVKEGYTVPGKLGIYGRSAGGLLIGASINMRPELFRCALTEVPFVDVLNTMFDSTIPWTAFEYEEWGNPNDQEIYEVMKTYCPYTNIRGDLLAKNVYPQLFVLGGMNDPRVAFFEPLKFVAKMRGERRKWRKILDGKGSDGVGFVNTPGKGSPSSSNSREAVVNTEERNILLRVQDAGHGGSSGQYAYLDDLALEYAFLITSLDAPAKPIFTGIQSSYDGTLTPVISSPLFSHDGRGSVVVGHPGVERVRSWVSEEGRWGRREGRGDGDGGGSRGSLERRREAKTRTDAEEREYRRKTKGDRGQNRVFQWVANLW